MSKKPQGWKNDSQLHSMAARGISVKNVGQNFEKDYESMQKAIDKVVIKNWTKFMSAKEGTVKIDGHEFDIISKDFESEPKVWHEVILIDDMMREWNIQYSPNWKGPKITHTQVASNLIKKAGKLMAQKEDIEDKYDKAVGKVGKFLNKSSAKTAKFINKTSKKIDKYMD